MKAVARTEAPVVIEGDGVEFRKQEIGGGMTVAFVHLPAGADLRPALVGLPDDMCPCPHWGYVISGRLRMHTPGGAEDFEAGEAFHRARAGGARGRRLRRLLAERGARPGHRPHHLAGVSGR